MAMRPLNWAVRRPWRGYEVASGARGAGKEMRILPFCRPFNVRNGRKRTLADPLVSQFSHADAGQWQPQHEQENVSPPRHAENEQDDC